MKILPKPYSIRLESGQTRFSASTVVVANDLIKKELFFLDFESGEKNEVRFEIAPTEYDYELVVDGDVKVVSSTDEGLFHGAMSLKQLIFDGYKDGVSYIDNCVVKDKPRFEYRGFMLDVVRHFFGKDVILGLIDSLALIKVNKFHLHLSDNQGYRLESKVFPVLNEKGNMRKGTRGDGVPVGGYLSQDDVREIVRYAEERYIEIIPEIDLPGHTLALLAAMPELGCTGEQYEVAERFGIDDRIMCAGREENYDFLEKLLAEVTALFPSKYFHLGGDEVPKTHWENCEKCKAKLKSEGLKNFEELQGYFTNRVINILKSRGKTPIVWNEAIYSGTLDESATCQYWSDGKRAERVVRAARAGRKVIVSKCLPYYLDYTYGVNSVKDTYKYNPAELFDDEAKKNIAGVECPLWTEYVPTVDKLYFQAFPRVIAVAESGWYDGDKDYADFEERLLNVLGIMQADDKGYAELKDANPNPFKGAWSTIKFGLNALDVIAIKSAINAMKAQKGRKL